MSYLDDFGVTLKEKCLADEPPFCQVACPFRIDPREFKQKWEKGRHNAAYRAYQTAVCFPAIVAEICPAPCEKACLLKERGGALHIRDLEKASVALAKRKSPNAYNLPPKGKKVAVIGAGLSGLACALRLLNKKYEVSIYESTDTAGGAARQMMDPAAFDGEIRNQYQYEEPDWHFGTAVTDPEPLIGDFDAVYIATGKGGDTFGFALTGEGAFATDRQGVFLGGMVTGTDAVGALADGIRASQAIERYLKTGLMNEPELCRDTKLVLDPESVEESPEVLPADPEKGYTEEEMSREASRCLSCSCDICQRECDLMRIHQKTPNRLYEEAYITVRPSTLANDGRWATRRVASCDQCGLCKTVCPARIDMGTFLLQSHRELVETDAMPWAFHDYWLRDMTFSGSEAKIVRKPEGTEKPRYAFFPGCQLAASDPWYVEEVYGWLREVLPDSALWMTCCGAPAEWAVADELHKKHLEELHREWEELGRPEVVFACPTCRKEFARYLPEIRGVFIEELLEEYGLPERSLPEEVKGMEFAVFDPCASRDYPGLQESVRRIAGKLGIAHRDLSHTGDRVRCCGNGGHYSIASPDYAKRVVMERAEESSLPYLTYCVNCRDKFASRGKESLHLLDLVFGLSGTRRPLPTLSERWENRRRVKEKLLQRFWGEKPGREEKTMKLLVEKTLERKLDEQQILISDMEQVVEACEREMRGVLDPATGRITGHKKIQNMTYWAVYEPLEGGAFRLINGYAHRMNLEGE